MSGFLDRLAAHAQGAAPVLRIRPRSRFEEVRPGPPDEVLAAVADEVPHDDPVPPPEKTDEVPESRPAERPAEAQRRPTPATPQKADRRPDVRPPPAERPATPIAATPLVQPSSEPAPPARDEPASSPMTHQPAAPAAAPIRSAPSLVDQAPPAPDPGPPPAGPVARRPARTPVPAKPPPPHEPEQDHTTADPEPADVRWPATAEVGQRVRAALRDAGLLAPAAGREAPTVRWPEETFPPEADLAVRLATDLGEPARRGQDVHLHVHLDRVEVQHPTPPARTVSRVDAPTAHRPASSVNHDAYLARRRENRR